MTNLLDLPLIITYLFILLMLILAVIDLVSFKGKHKDYKSVIISLGVLGTFTGIFIGLLEFDTANIKQSVPVLLEGLKIAFSTSIAGMGLSIFLATYQIWAGSEKAARQAEELATINSAPENHQALNEAIAALNQQVQRTGESLNTTLAELRLRPNEHSAITETPEQTSTIANFSTEKLEAGIEQLNQTLKAQNQEQINVNHLIITMEKILNTSRESISLSNQQLNQALEKQQKQDALSEQLSKAVKTFQTETKAIQSKLDTIDLNPSDDLQQLTESLEKLKTELDDSKFDYIDSLVEKEKQLVHVFSNLEDHLQALMQNTSGKY